MRRPRHGFYKQGEGVFAVAIVYVIPCVIASVGVPVGEVALEGVVDVGVASVVVALVRHEMKHLGAAMASYGSTPLFHLHKITPEAKNLKIEQFDNLDLIEINSSDFESLKSL